MIDIPPSSDSIISYKKSEPLPTSQQSTTKYQIKVSVVPNPFHTMATVKIDAPKDIPLSVTLYDELGRKVSDLTNGSAMQTHSEFTLTSEKLSTGFYYLRVQSGNEVVTRKIQLLK